MLASRTSPRAAHASTLRCLMVVLASFAAASCSDLVTQPEVDADAPKQALVAKQQAVARLFSARAGCSEGTLPGGALYEVCAPAAWNGGIVFYAHGYVAAGEPVALPEDTVGGLAVVDIVRALGFVYATTSYRDNGLVAADAVTDLEQLGELVQGAHPALAAAPAYLVGVSEGGLATALAMQNPATPFDGGLAMCGPVGDFEAQTNYMGDFRLVFDHFFPGVLPGAPFDPADLLPLQAEWESVWEPAIRAAIEADLAAGGERTQQLFAVTRASWDPADVGQSAADILWYAVFGTPDAAVELGGLPFDNTARWYAGSRNDLLLNAVIPRFAFSADPAELARYETTGQVERPTVTLHTTGDQIIPWWHEPLYGWKAYGQGDFGQLTIIRSDRYGHCQFTVPEVLTAFAVLSLRVASRQLMVSAEVFAGEAEERAFLRSARARGAEPTVTDRRFRDASGLR